MNKLKIAIIPLFILSFLFSGTDGTIRGQVTDSDGVPLVGAQIYIPKLSKGTTADIDGNYILINIPVGEYEVRCQMIGYQTNILTGAGVTMDQTTWLNFSLPVSSIEGDVVRVSSQRRLVEKGTTSKKITVNQEAIETLPIKDVSDLYNLQSGVVKVESLASGIPDHSERGLEEVHVRGGRSGEIAYMIDGMYIRNPIFGGIGNGTRLNKFAIREFDWQPGGFNAEYGDAMSAVSNLHTMTGGSEFSYKFQYETSLIGSALGSRYDELRDYNDYNFGMGGSLPFYKKINLWTSAQSTSSGNFSVFKFDDYVYDTSYPDGVPFFELLLVQQNDPDFFEETKYNYTWPWDNVSGYRGFGFDNTVDYFGKIGWDLSSQFKLTFSYWNVEAHRKSFNPAFIYWDDGRQELFRDTERYAFEINHTIDKKSFYTIRASKFVQDQFIGVRNTDSDNDGYPDWFEWRYPAGYASSSDPYNPDIMPYHLDNEELVPYIDQRDGNGPEDFTSGWYYGAVPGNYNWNIAEEFTDFNENGLCDFCPGTDSYGQGESEFLFENDINGNGVWDGPVLLEEAIYRDGDYWLTPEMYINSEPFDDSVGGWLVNEGLSPVQTSEPNGASNAGYLTATSPGEDPSQLYFSSFAEGNIFGGSDRFYSTSTAETNEIRFDFTSQVTNKWRARFGVDYKTHKLNFYEITEPWNGSSAFRQRFSERWDDFGVDQTEYVESQCTLPDVGEGNGVWDGPGYYTNPCNDQLEYFPGEVYDDFNGDDKWNDYVEPEEFSAYFQNTYEVPWMVVNLGVRLDAVQYNTKIWADDLGNFSPYTPYFYFDCGSDVNVLTGEVMCPSDSYALSTGFNVSSDGQSIGVNVVVRDNQFYEGYKVDPLTGDYLVAGQDENGNILYEPTDAAIQINNECQGCSSEELRLMLQNALVVDLPLLDDMTGNGIWDEGEITTDNISETTGDSKVIFKPSDWLYKISPRLGISHVISDGATFTFNYGLYYQTPIYEFIYRNVSKLEDPGSAFEDAGNSGSSIGNATMTAGRTQSYELAFNMEITREWAFSAGVWVKDMDQLTTAAQFSSGVYEFKVAKNGDFGTAVGFDFTVENRGSMFNTTVQYTYSTAKASSAYDAEAFGSIEVDAPQQETLMPYDRTHDLTLSLYSTKLPFGLNGGVTAFFQSGEPYTGVRFNGDKPEEDLLNKYGKRAPSLVKMDLSLSKEFQLKDQRMMMGLNVFNLFDKPYIIDVYPLTGNATRPGEYYEKDIGREISGSFYDRPWMYSSNREINFFIRMDFN